LCVSMYTPSPQTDTLSLHDALPSCEPQHMAVADPPGAGPGTVGDRSDVRSGGVARSAPVVLEEGADQPADGVRGGCGCLGHGRAVVVRRALRGHRCLSPL